MDTKESSEVQVRDPWSGYLTEEMREQLAEGVKSLIKGYVRMLEVVLENDTNKLI